MKLNAQADIAAVSSGMVMATGVAIETNNNLPSARISGIGAQTV